MRINRLILQSGFAVMLFAQGFATTVEAQAHSGQQVMLPSTRVKLAAPSGWIEVGSAEVIANRKRIVLKSEELRKAVAARARLPQFAFTKYPADHDSLNPSVQFVSRPLPEGLGALGAIEQGIAALKSAVNSFELVDKPTTKKFGGREGAIARVRYKVAGPSGDSYAVESRMIAIVDGNELTIIGFTTSVSGPDRCEKEFQSLIASIEPM
jgi:hypothetical protein